MLKTGFIDEIELEFGNGNRHVDIKFGILNHGTLDSREREDAKKINIAVIGLPESINGFLEWLKECNDGIDAKDTSKSNLFPKFPGFGCNSPFNAEWECSERAMRYLSLSKIKELESLKTPGEIIKGAVKIYASELDYIANEIRPDVIFCITPNEIADQLDRAVELPCTKIKKQEDIDDAERVNQHRYDFHHCLKSEAMIYKIPIQMIYPSTFGVGKRGKSTKNKRRNKKQRQLQDPATCAWNLFTAMYYKAGGTPWRLARQPNDFTTCYVGVSFYRSLDEKTVMTSIAQIFNERGEGVVVRGGQAMLSKKDRTPHLNRDDSVSIITQALKRYRDEHKTSPARVVIHKSSYFTDEEQKGFRDGLEQERISMVDMLSIRKSNVRLFRSGAYPVLRGTHLQLDSQRHLLYTRGSVPFFETYPGLYLPRALEIQFDSIEQSRELLCNEILALTKMNWNNTQFDMSEPITLRAARSVGDIMKYIPAEASLGRIASRYSFYM